jgi:outer membrane protein TolC
MHRVPKSEKGPLCARFSQLAFLLMYTLLQLPAAQAQTVGRVMTLPEAVDTALTANLELKKSHKEIEAAEATKKAQRTYFFPTLNTTYQAIRTDKPAQFGGSLTGVAQLQNEYNLTAGFSQPIFQGFALLNQYQIADLGLDVAQLNRKLSRLQVIFLAKEAYFQVLKAEKLRQVAADSVKVLESQVEVARNFYEVGMTPLNDLLQTQVELANSRQELIVAQNNLNVAQSQFNIVLQRPVNAPVTLADIQSFAPLAYELDYYLTEAEKNRLEIKVADLQIQIAEKELGLARKDFYPTISLEGNYFWRSSKWYLDPNLQDSNGWSITGVATWDFWEWGRTSYGEREKRSRLSQAKISRDQALFQIRLEVEQSYLKTRESEKNIVTIETAIEQAKENMRITEERYKEQAATSTDILIAQNLLFRTQTNFFNALYDFKIAKAFLQKSIGLEILE